MRLRCCTSRTPFRCPHRWSRGMILRSKTLALQEERLLADLFALCATKHLTISPFFRGTWPNIRASGLFRAHTAPTGANSALTSKDISSRISLQLLILQGMGSQTQLRVLKHKILANVLTLRVKKVLYMTCKPIEDCFRSILCTNSLSFLKHLDLVLFFNREMHGQQCKVRPVPPCHRSLLHLEHL